MVVLTDECRLSRGNEALLASLQEMAGWDEDSRDSMMQTMLSQMLVLRRLHDQGDTLCVMSRDGRVVPLAMGDICQLGAYDEWSGWQDEDQEWPQVPTIRIVQHADRQQGFYCVIFELHSFGFSTRDERFAAALYHELPANLSVNNLAVEPDFVVVVSELNTTPEAAEAMVEHCLHEIQAVLVLEEDNHHDVVRVDEQDFANPDNAIGFIEPNWQTDDLVEAVRDGRI